MRTELKVFLISLPLAVTMYVILIVAGYMLWGDDWNMAGLPVVSLATGYVAYRIAKGHFERTSRSR